MKKSPVLSEKYPTVKIVGKTLTLTPTLQAAREITVAFGGIKNAFDRVRAIDPDASAVVIAAGAGIKFKNQAEADQFTTDVFFNTDSDDYRIGVMQFITLMLSGGKKPKAEDESDDTEEETKDAAKGN